MFISTVTLTSGLDETLNKTTYIIFQLSGYEETKRSNFFFPKYTYNTEISGYSFPITFQGLPRQQSKAHRVTDG